MEWTTHHSSQQAGDYWVIPVNGLAGETWAAYLVPSRGQPLFIGSAQRAGLARELCEAAGSTLVEVIEDEPDQLQWSDDMLNGRAVVTVEWDTDALATELAPDTQAVIARRRGRPANIMQLKQARSKLWHASQDGTAVTLCGKDLSDQKHQLVSQQPKYVSCVECVAALGR